MRVRPINQMYMNKLRIRTTAADKVMSIRGNRNIIFEALSSVLRVKFHAYESTDDCHSNKQRRVRPFIFILLPVLQSVWLIECVRPHECVKRISFIQGSVDRGFFLARLLVFRFLRLSLYMWVNERISQLGLYQYIPSLNLGMTCIYSTLSLSASTALLITILYLIDAFNSLIMTT